MNWVNSRTLLHFKEYFPTNKNERSSSFKTLTTPNPLEITPVNMLTCLIFARELPPDLINNLLDNCSNQKCYLMLDEIQCLN